MMQLNVGSLTERAIHYCKQTFVLTGEKLPWLIRAVLLHTCSGSESRIC